MSRPLLLARCVAVISIVLILGVVVYDTLSGWPAGAGQVAAVLVNTSVGLTYVAMGWLLIERRRGNAVGGLLLTVGCVYAFAGPLDWYLSMGRRDGPARDYVALTYLLAATPIKICLSLAVILFPDGRLPSPRWRWPVVGLMVAIALGGVALIFGVTPFRPGYPTLVSPLGIPGFPKQTLQTIADLAEQIALVVGFLALVVRWRRGGQTNRAQVKWVIAASTLAVAALFNPLRHRVQVVVDRRFHRARYDAERTVAIFAGQLRHQLDLPTLTGELRRTTVEAVEPRTSSVWLPSRTAPR